MIDSIETMNASAKTWMTMLEGETEWEGRTARVLYNAFAGFDEQQACICCETIIDHGYDGVLAFFDPTCVEQGPARIGLSLPEGGMIKLRSGQLWMAPHGDRVVLLTRDKARGHYAVEDGRIVRRPSWPAEDIERGAHRAAARLAELTADCARADAMAL